jgi:hypothetical protein
MARFWPRPRKAERKEKDELAALTPLERLALDAGPIRPDGTDKFYGFENVCEPKTKSLGGRAGAGRWRPTLPTQPMTT